MLLKYFLLGIYEKTQYILYKILKEGRPPVKPEASGVQHKEDCHHVLSGRISVDGTFQHQQLI